ncbi:hypothetical protein H5410_002594 [Solanum commersonii]|uniref:Uncharacterized protein n=1 Tax=Solanum commersonii TaxID=4109 RepID=A0A9J6B286_SOLCO|nr:hypothetical protein H5410_002594 [Solanum commersonii]
MWKTEMISKNHEISPRRKTTFITNLRKSFSGKEVDASNLANFTRPTPLPILKRSEGALFLHYFSSLFLSKFRVSIVVLLIHIPVRISKERHFNSLLVLVLISSKLISRYYMPWQTFLLCSFLCYIINTITLYWSLGQIDMTNKDEDDAIVGAVATSVLALELQLM